MPHTDIVDMQHNDGLQPIAAQKLNYNFKRLASQLDAINQILDGRANDNKGAAKKADAKAVEADAKAEEALLLIPYPSDDNPLMDGIADPGKSADYSRGDHVHPTDTSRAPVDHKSTSNTYGQGGYSNFGHVKLSSATDSTLATGDGTAATPLAVKNALDAAKSYTDGVADSLSNDMSAALPSKRQYDVKSLVTSTHSNVDSVDSAVLVTYGMAAHLLIEVTTGSSTFNVGTSYNLLTIGTAIRPAQRAAVSFDPSRADGILRYNGQVYVRPNAQIAAGTSLFVSSTYILDNEYNGPIS